MDNVIFIISILMFVFIFGTAFCCIFSRKFREKMMEKRMESLRHMTNYTKDDMEKIMTDLTSISINAKNNAINQNEDALKNIYKKEAEIKKEGIKITAEAIKEGFSQEGTIFCKHCGFKIDEDSKFCKKCGKEQ